MNKKAIIITVSSIALLGAGIGLYFYFRKANKEENKDGEKPLSEKEIKDLIKLQGGALGDSDETEYSSKDKIVGDVTLNIGSKGRRVAILQALLNHYKGAKLLVDGSFGDKTRAALFNNGSGYLKCAVSATCKVTTEEFLELLKRTKSDKTFWQKYSPNVNKDMKAVYDKYSS